MITQFGPNIDIAIKTYEDTAAYVDPEIITEGLRKGLNSMHVPTRQGLIASIFIESINRDDHPRQKIEITYDNYRGEPDSSNERTDSIMRASFLLHGDTHKIPIQKIALSPPDQWRETPWIEVNNTQNKLYPYESIDWQEVREHFENPAYREAFYEKMQSLQSKTDQLSREQSSRRPRDTKSPQTKRPGAGSKSAAGAGHRGPTR